MYSINLCCVFFFLQMLSYGYTRKLKRNMIYWDMKITYIILYNRLCFNLDIPLIIIQAYRLIRLNFNKWGVRIKGKIYCVLSNRPFRIYYWELRKWKTLGFRPMCIRRPINSRVWLRVDMFIPWILYRYVFVFVVYIYSSRINN